MLRSLRKVASGFLAGLMLLSASAMAENIPNDVPLQQIAAEAGADNYYQEAIETEIYNYKLVRNLPTTGHMGNLLLAGQWADGPGRGEFGGCTEENGGRRRRSA